VEDTADYSAFEATWSLGLLIEAVDEYAIFALDPAGAVRTWNIGAQRIKGYAEHEILGQHFSVFYPAADRRSNLPEQELAHAVEHGHWAGQGWRVRKDGTPFWANVVITAVFDPHGLLDGFVKVTRDETDRRAAEEAAHQLAVLREREQLAIELTDTTVRGVFSATLALGGAIGMAHDPLVEARLLDAMAILDRTITQIRSLAMGSPPDGDPGADPAT
jgi:PAS domain S-box-containing protein